MRETERLDKTLVKRGLVNTRSIAQAMIMAGRVVVNGSVVNKAGHHVSGSEKIEIIEPTPYVSRGGLKIEGAFNKIDSIKIENKVCIDIGASTGGFTDFLLKQGASLIYAVDVGKGLLSEKLMGNERIVVLDNTNARYIDRLTFEPQPTLATIDVSFISLKLIIPPLLRIMSKPADIIALIKPQFEADRKYVKKGVVRDKQVIESVVKKIENFIIELGCEVRNIVPSTLKGPKGNQEYFVCFKYQ
ncbi:MAG: TlyA family rRNA (cytidine-2'-O)-methyltransferase [Candidatus Coatesbacteria bacterium]|nr:MAG: TlyA family rRNA (cytidine-2'-O)-methyltransferase [Candidatus Coatesbacteria bacterium]HEC79998.1 TlyA family RNA methyltransferase [Bacillota bacterium]